MTGKENEVRKLTRAGSETAFDDEDVPQAAVIAKTLRVSLSNLQLYPPESQFIKDSISLAHNSLAPLLAKYGSVTFSEAEGRLLANKKPLSLTKADDFASAGLLTAFAACNLRSVVFKAGLDVAGLTGFIRNLGQKKPFEDDAKWAGIELEDKIYIGAGAEDLVVEGGVKYAAGIEAKLAEMCKGIESVTAAIAKADDCIRARDKEKEKLAGTMSGLKPDELLDLLLKDLPADQEKVKYEALRALPPEKVKQMVELLSARFKEAQAAPAQAAPVKAGFNKIFDLVKDTAISEDVYKDLVAKGLSKELPSVWAAQVSRPEDMAQKQAGLLLAGPDAALLEASAQGQLTALIKKLDLYGKSELVRTLLEKISRNLYSASGQTRLLALKCLAGLLPALEALSDSDIVRTLDDKLAAVCDGEGDGPAYIAEAELLSRAAGRLWRAGQYAKAANLLAMLRRHADSPERDFPAKADHARKALEGVAGGELMRLLVSDLASPDARRLEYALGVAGKLGYAACPALIAAVKKNDDFHFRKIAAGAIKETGPEGAVYLAKALEEARTLETAMRIISVLYGIGGSGNVTDELKRMLLSSDPVVRRFALLALHKVGGPGAGGAFLEAARDPDPIVKRESVRLLGERKLREAVGLIVDFISPSGAENEDLQAEACFALGKIGDEKALQPLINAALPSGFLFFRKAKPSSVRKAAILALRCFKTGKAADALKKLTKDSDAEISNLARSGQAGA